MPNLGRKAELVDDFAAVVKARRIGLGVTQEAIAYAAKLEQTVVSKIERGSHRPGAAIARRLALALKLPESALIKLADPEQ